MSSRNRTIAVLSQAVFIMVVAAGSTSAQLVINNPPTPAKDIINHTNCTAQLTFITNPMGVWPLVVLVPAHGTVRLPVRPGPMSVNGVVDMTGFFYPFAPSPPPPGIACGPNELWISSVILGPPPGCCFDICADPNGCTIELRKPPGCN